MIRLPLVCLLFSYCLTCALGFAARASMCANRGGPNSAKGGNEAWISRQYLLRASAGALISSVWIAQGAAALDPTVTPEEALAAATRATPAVTATVTPVEQPPAMPQVGAAAPNFNLPFSSRASDGTVSLEQLAGKWVVLYFYPADGTSVCSIEAARFQKNLEAFRERGVQILGVSLDDVASHRSFCSDLKLDFPLLADANGETSYKYGALVTDPQYGAYALRTTFLIDPEGIVRHVWPRVTAAARHADEVLAKVDALRTRKS